ncbi:MAG: hypothetical protein RR057_04800, partial [Clostridia bacterium]
FFLIYSIGLSVLFQIAFSQVKTIEIQLAFTCATCFLMLAPFIVNVIIIKKYDIKTIREFILNDILFVALPAVIASVISEVIVIVCTPKVSVNGIGTVIFAGIVILLMLIFWIVYAVLNVVYKNRP